MQEAHDATGSLVQTLLELPLFESEWVLWLLLGLSVASIAVMLERFLFYKRRAVDVDVLRRELARHLERGDLEAAAAVLQRHDTMETNVVLVGLKAYEKGPESVEDLLAAALGREKARYEKRLSFLATLASNAPYIGLFGTVLGIIRAFRDLAANMAEASQAVMAGIGEALVATGVGLLVAIPAVIAYNVFKGRVKHAAVECQMLANTLLAHLKSAEPDGARSE
jgi:biopolymer transport protein ExbB/TolQ